MHDQLPAAAVVPKRYDDECRGTAHMLVAFKPLTGWRWVEVIERRWREFAEVAHGPAEEVYLRGRKGSPAVRNLHVYTAAFYESSAPSESAKSSCRS